MSLRDPGIPAVLLTFGLCLGTLSCHGPADESASPPDTRILLELEAEFGRAAAERDVDRFMSFWAADAAFLPMFEPIQDSPESIRAMWAELLEDPGARLTWQPVRAEMAASGDLGFTYGEYQLTRHTPGGEPRISVGKYVTIWRKNAEGTWQVLLDTGSPNQAPPSP